MEKKKKSYLTSNPEDALFTNPVASSNDCTGYINTLPESEEEAESYSDLLNVPVTHSKKLYTPPKNKRERQSFPGKST